MSKTPSSFSGLHPTKRCLRLAVIAAVRNVTPALLERERWQRTGPKYLKLVGRVLYRKADVLQWIEQLQEPTLITGPIGVRGGSNV